MGRFCFLCVPQGSVNIDAFSPQRITPPPAPRREPRRLVSEPEKVAGAIRMFRTWRLSEEGDLRAMVAQYVWSPGENRAMMTAVYDREHGFYGFSTLDELRRQEPTWWRRSLQGPLRPAEIWPADMLLRRPAVGTVVSGTFLAYGRVKIATKGARASAGWPEYIIEPEDADPDFGLRILNVAERYKMKIISVKTAEELKTGVVPWSKPTQ